MTFQLDTSGEIVLPYPKLHPHPRGVIWSDLDPFTLGYVETMAREKSDIDGRPLFAFRQLAPETLARIMEDCAQFKAGAGYYTADDARNFWRRRQAGLEQKHGFPPLTVALNDDGKVVFA